MRQASASPWFPCPKCGYPVNMEKDFLGTSNPNLRGERFHIYKCPNCAWIIRELASVEDKKG